MEDATTFFIIVSSIFSLIMLIILISLATNVSTISKRLTLTNNILLKYAERDGLTKQKKHDDTEDKKFVKKK